MMGSGRGETSRNERKRRGRKAGMIREYGSTRERREEMYDLTLGTGAD